MGVQDFIAEVLPYARQASQQTGVPTSIIIAQAGIESAWGTSGLSTKYNNIFGIKGPGVVMKTKEFEGGQYVTKNASFRTYGSMGESVLDYEKVIGYSRYAPVREATDYKEAAVALKKAGYATDPAYPAMLIERIEKLGLQKYDNPAYTGVGSGMTQFGTKAQTGQTQPGNLLPDPLQGNGFLGVAAGFAILLLLFALFTQFLPAT